jgi:hypothetical protein
LLLALLYFFLQHGMPIDPGPDCSSVHSVPPQAHPLPSVWSSVLSNFSHLHFEDTNSEIKHFQSPTITTPAQQPPPIYCWIMVEYVPQLVPLNDGRPAQD